MEVPQKRGWCLSEGAFSSAPWRLGPLTNIQVFIQVHIRVVRPTVARGLHMGPEICLRSVLGA